MTADELEQLILENRDPWALQRAMAGLAEGERAKLSTAAQKIHSQLSKSQANATASDRLKAVIARRGKDTWRYWNSAENQQAALALFGVGPLSVVKKPAIYLGQNSQVLEQIIRDRRPEWIDEWIAHQLEQQFTHLTFPTIRAWIRDGICRKPEVDGYYRMFASYLMRTGFYHGGEKQKVPPISKQLLADPDLIDDIEGLFRVENIAFNTNSWLVKGASDDHETWTDALIKLSAEGKVDRGQLLGYALDGLTRDLKQNQLSGFHGFYRKMKPTPEEIAGHQQRYIDLLCHPVGHVVKFSIDMLSEVDKQGSLDTGPVVREIQSVFAGQSKGNATAALKLLKRIIARTKGADPDVLAAVVEALRNGHAEVQGQALDLLEAQRGSLGGAEREAIAGAMTFVAASNRSRLAALLGALPASSAAEPEAATNDNAEPEAATNDNAEAVPAAPQPAAAYRPISDDINAQQILFPEDALQPIGSIDELIDTIFHAVEVVDSPDEVERIIDGISRFGGDRLFDFDAKVAPLLHRMEKGRTGSNGLSIGFGGVGLALSDLLFTWLTGKRYHTPDRGYSHYALEHGFQPIIAHLRAITSRVAQRKARPLLSAPTHNGGWIDPLEWVERLAEATKCGEKPSNSTEFRLSMLRLSPDNRAQALERVDALDPAIRRVASFALGGDELPRAGDRKHYSAWITAARCREPLKDWSVEFAPLRLQDELPDALRPAHYRWRASLHRDERYGQSWSRAEFDLSVGAGDRAAGEGQAGGVLARLGQSLSGRIRTEWTELPTAALNHQTKRKTYFWGETHTPWVAHWLSYIWPQNPSAALMKAAIKLTERIDDNASGWTPSAGHFQALFQRNRPWLEAGHLLVALGIAGKDADARGLAIDALIEGIEDRRFDPSLFASVLARLAEGEWVKFNRLGDALMQVVPVSELHAAVVGEMLQASLPLLDLQQRSAFRLLEVLVEARAAANQPLAGAARAALAGFTGSGKAAKLAKQLLSA